MIKSMFRKNIAVLFLSLFCMLSAYADKNLKKDITMVSYEQGWLDSEGTLALKNNTDADIRNVVFQITYLDMSGKPLDYKEFTRDVPIAPGMTKKFDIPAYEHKRDYHYYRSENRPGGSPAFKIEFELKDYNVESVPSEYDELDEFKDDFDIDKEISKYQKRGFEDWLFFVMGLGVLLFFIGISVGLYVLVAVMAQNRHRSVVAWILLSLIATPLLMIIILFFLGDNGDDYDSRYDV